MPSRSHYHGRRRRDLEKKKNFIRSSFYRSPQTMTATTDTDLMDLQLAMEADWFGGESDTVQYPDNMEPNTEKDVWTRSQYAQVVFEDMADTYDNQKEMACQCTLTGNLLAESTDMIGLFRVPYLASGQSVVLQEVGAASAGLDRVLISFEKGQLPQDEDFYQLQYLRQNKVFGASVPFQLRRPGTPDSSSGALLEEDDEEFIRVDHQMEAAYKRLQQLYVSLSIQLHQTTDQLKQSEQRCADLEGLSSGLREELDGSLQSFVVLKEEHSRFQESRVQEINQLKTDFACALQDKLILEEKLHRRLKTANEAQQEADQAQARIRQLVMERDALLLEKKSWTDQCDSQTNVLQAMTMAKELASKELTRQMEKNAKLQREVKRLEALMASYVENTEYLQNTVDQLRGECGVSPKEESQAAGLLLQRMESLSESSQHQELLSCRSGASCELIVQNLQERLSSMEQQMQNMNKAHKDQIHLIGEEVDKLKSLYRMNSGGHAESMSSSDSRTLLDSLVIEERVANEATAVITTPPPSLSTNPFVTSSVCLTPQLTASAQSVSAPQLAQSLFTSCVVNNEPENVQQAQPGSGSALKSTDQMNQSASSFINLTTLQSWFYNSDPCVAVADEAMHQQPVPAESHGSEVAANDDEQPLPTVHHESADTSDGESRGWKVTLTDYGKAIEVPESSGLLTCPICSRQFQPTEYYGLCQHVESHLDSLLECPICSLAFSSQHRPDYQRHVHSHFEHDSDQEDLNLTFDFI